MHARRTTDPEPSPATVQPRLLTMTQVEVRTGFKRSYLQKRRAEGSFPAPIKIARSSRWRAEDVDAWIDARIAEGAA